MSENDMLINLGKKAKDASYKLMNLSTNVKNQGLNNIKLGIIKNMDFLLRENAKDIESAKAKGMATSMLDRLALNEKRIGDMAEGLNQIISLPDPVGEVLSMCRRPNDLRIGKKRVPLGVVGIIYEARPNVTLDAAALCLKSGNAAILRGGSEAIHSNVAIVKVIKEALKEAGLPEDTVGIVEDTSREVASSMMKLNKYINVLIPRGGAGLIKSVVENATIPVIETGVGNCHVFVDDSSDFEMAKSIIINAKTSRPSVCNAIENLLVDKKIGKEFIPLIFKSLLESKVEIKCCNESLNILNESSGAFTEDEKSHIVLASEEDYYKEFLDLIIAVKIVENIDEAIAHINKYGTGHSEAIITSNYERSQKFLDEVDAAAVYVNASTRFTDGFEFGFGAEIGISTQKLHARGPMGLNELTTYKYIIYGKGQVR